MALSAVAIAHAAIRREGQDDFWLNLGLVFPHKDGSGFNIMLQAFPLDGKIVCREITAGDEPIRRSRSNGATGGAEAAVVEASHGREQEHAQSGLVL